MSKHTPGPWKADIRTGMFSVYPACDDHNCLHHDIENEVARQSGKGEESQPKGYRYLTDEQIANALLITAAPEMLIALELAMHALNTAPRFRVPSLDTKEERMDSYKIASMVSAIIKKAKGE